jgi:MFS family permease
VLLGGVLTSALGWRSVLFVNVPIGIAAILIAPRLLSESKGEVARGFDLPGAALVTAGLSALVYALVRAASVGWGSAQTIGMIAAAVMLLAGFVQIERRSRRVRVRGPRPVRARGRAGDTAGAVFVLPQPQRDAR